MKRITPHLWFDKQAKEAAAFYVSLFPHSKITRTGILKDTPSGDCDTVAFELAGQPFMAISAGPLFKFNPSISFFLNFDPAQDPHARAHLDATWAKLAEGGQALMPLDRYPFSERYGWIQDRYGLSWQLILAKPEGEARPFIVPSLLFTGAVAGKAEEALSFYTTVFSGSWLGSLQRYPAGSEPEKPGSLMYGDCALNDQWFAAMDSALEHKFAFNEAVSLLIPCESQVEIDHFWRTLAADPEGGQCGWTRDRFGVCWQVSPAELGDMLAQGDAAQVKRVTEAFLRMKKFHLAELRQAYLGL